MKNFSTEAIEEFTIKYQINGGDVISETISETLPPFSAQIVSFSTPLDYREWKTLNYRYSYLEGDSNPETTP